MVSGGAHGQSPSPSKGGNPVSFNRWKADGRAGPVQPAPAPAVPPLPAPQALPGAPALLAEPIQQLPAAQPVAATLAAEPALEAVVQAAPQAAAGPKARAEEASTDYDGPSAYNVNVKEQAHPQSNINENGEGLLGPLPSQLAEASKPEPVRSFAADGRSDRKRARQEPATLGNMQPALSSLPLESFGFARFESQQEPIRVPSANAAAAEVADGRKDTNYVMMQFYMGLVGDMEGWQRRLLVLQKILPTGDAETAEWASSESVRIGSLVSDARGWIARLAAGGQPIGLGIAAAVGGGQEAQRQVAPPVPSNPSIPPGHFTAPGFVPPAMGAGFLSTAGTASRNLGNPYGVSMPPSGRPTSESFGGVPWQMNAPGAATFDNRGAPRLPPFQPPPPPPREALGRGRGFVTEPAPRATQSMGVPGAAAAGFRAAPPAVPEAHFFRDQAPHPARTTSQQGAGRPERGISALENVHINSWGSNRSGYGGDSAARQAAADAGRQRAGRQLQMQHEIENFYHGRLEHTFPEHETGSLNFPRGSYYVEARVVGASGGAQDIVFWGRAASQADAIFLAVESLWKTTMPPQMAGRA